MPAFDRRNGQRLIVARSPVEGPGRLSASAGQPAANPISPASALPLDGNVGPAPLGLVIQSELPAQLGTGVLGTLIGDRKAKRQWPIGNTFVRQLPLLESRWGLKAEIVFRQEWVLRLETVANPYRHGEVQGDRIALAPSPLDPYKALGVGDDAPATPLTPIRGSAHQSGMRK